MSPLKVSNKESCYRLAAAGCPQSIPLAPEGIIFPPWPPQSHLSENWELNVSQIRIMWGWQWAARLSPCQHHQGGLGSLWREMVGSTTAGEGLTSVPTLGWNDALEGSGTDPAEGSEQPWFIPSCPSMLEMCLTLYKFEGISPE